jgi:CRP-like cAMP-binding protein
MDIFKALKRNKLFFTFSNEEANHLIKILNGHCIRYSKNCIPINVGDIVNNIGIVIRGSILNYTINPDNQQNIAISRIHSGGMLGIIEIFTDELKFLCSSVIIDDAEILYLDNPLTYIQEKYDATIVVFIKKLLNLFAEKLKKECVITF